MNDKEFDDIMEEEPCPTCGCEESGCHEMGCLSEDWEDFVSEEKDGE